MPAIGVLVHIHVAFYRGVSRSGAKSVVSLGGIADGLRDFNGAGGPVFGTSLLCRTGAASAPGVTAGESPLGVEFEGSACAANCCCRRRLAASALRGALTLLSLVLFDIIIVR